MKLSNFSIIILVISGPLLFTPEIEAQNASTEVETGLFRKRKKSASGSFQIAVNRPAGISVAAVRRQAEDIARLQLPYVFGGCSPADGGMDCSGSIKHLLNSLGFREVPRTSFAQYDWVRQNSRFKRTRNIDPENLKPGDLIFWGGTYNSGHKVSHVMMYMGKATDGKLYMFGARSKKNRGVSGAGVDIHELRPGHHNNLVGFGRIPGV